MIENPYASPEEVVETMTEHQTRLLRVRRGLAWMMGSYVWIAGTLVGGAMLSEALIRPMSDFESPILRVGMAVGSVGCGLIFLGMQFLAAWNCRQCPVEMVRRGRTWIFAGGMFYGMFFLAMLILWFLNSQFAWRHLGDARLLPATVAGWVAVWCFGISGWFWQYFLLELARGTKSDAGTLAGWGVILLFSVAGFCTMFFFGVMLPYDMYRLHGTVTLTAMISGVGFMGLYAWLLAWLWRRIGKFVVCSS